jgi:hypothetical protein
MTPREASQVVFFPAAIPGRSGDTDRDVFQTAHSPLHKKSSRPIYISIFDFSEHKFELATRGRNPLP